MLRAAPVAAVARALDELRVVLYDPLGSEGLPGRIDTIAGNLVSLIANDADQVLFEVHRLERGRHELYSVTHAARCAIACDLVARRLRRPDAERGSLVRAALTMNIAITELQGSLAARGVGQKQLTPQQARAIVSHPSLGADLLRTAGVVDADWLQAVAQHHERADGKGYPTEMRHPSPLAVVLRYVDEFFAKISPRASRPALPLRAAARQLYANAEGRPIVEALVKELGLYPPGTFVRLANGELGVVLRRGERVHAPIAVALANRNGDRLSRRTYRDTGDARYAIVMSSNAGTA